MLVDGGDAVHEEVTRPRARPPLLSNGNPPPPLAPGLSPATLALNPRREAAATALHGALGR
eukprot:11224568-Lingulodinium_polyedra.AAC.1